jgi:hypothetical protein
VPRCKNKRDVDAKLCCVSEGEKLNGGFVRTLLLQHIEILRDAPTTCLVKLRCSKEFTGHNPVKAVREDGP